MAEKIANFKQFLAIAGEQIEKSLKKQLMVFQVVDDDGTAAVLEIAVHKKATLKDYAQIVVQKVSYTQMTPRELRNLIKSLLAPMVKQQQVRVSESLDLDDKKVTIRILKMIEWLFDANEYVCQTQDYSQHVKDYLRTLEAFEDMDADVRQLATKVLAVVKKS